MKREDHHRKKTIGSNHPWLAQKSKDSAPTMIIGNSQQAKQSKSVTNREETKIDKLKMIQERRNKYFQTKETEDLYQKEKAAFFSKESFTSSAPRPSSYSAPSSSKVDSKPSSQLDPHTDQLLQQLTHKLTNHITENLMKQHLDSQLNTNEEVCNTILSRIDEFVANELSSFCCPICYEIMAPPTRLPMLLFPCGHTFCQACIEQHSQRAATSRLSAATMAGGQNRACPYCREKIESRAINQSLKELIDQFLAQKGKIEARTGSVQDLFVSQKSGSTSHSTSNSRSESLPSTSSVANRQQYLNQYKSYEMRYTILKNELDELLLEQDTVEKKKQKISFATSHLLEEKEKVKQKIQLLQEEQQLIDQHLDTQEKKLAEVNEFERTTREKTALIQSTLRTLVADMEKLKLLAQGVENG